MLKIFKKVNIPTKKEVIAHCYDLFWVILGCSILAFSIIGILIPSGLSSGGLTGIVIILQEVLPFKFSLMYYIGAGIIFIAGLIFLKFKEARNILFVSIVFPSIMMIFERLDIILLEQDDIFLAAVYCGVIGGIGIGIVLQRGFLFGGTDTIAKIIRRKILPAVSLSQIMLVIDAIVIISSGFVFGRNIALYALITTAIKSKVSNVIMFGFDDKLVKMEIITTKNKEVSDYILHVISRGVTSIRITGAYTGDQKEKLVTICSPRESMLIKSFLSNVDKTAFISVMQMDSVWGRGNGFGSLE